MYELLSIELEEEEPVFRKNSVNKQTPNLGLCSVTCTLQCVCAVFSLPFRVQCYMYCLMCNMQCAIYIAVLCVPYMQCALYTVETEW